MTDQWMIKAREYANCNCNFGCPCQFNAPSTHGFCEAIAGIIIDEGSYNDVDMAGACFAGIYKWPGEIAEGNGEAQLFISDAVTPEQRDAIIKIATGETTEPGATHFSVFASTLSTFHPIIDAPIEIAIDVDARKSNLKIGNMVESSGTSLLSPFNGEEVHAGIHLPGGFEYTYAETGMGSTQAKTGDIELTLSDSYSHFCLLHMNQNGVIRN
jgi:hypothetical protein